MRGLFSYLDYRQFLKDRFLQLKSEERQVTHRSLAKKAGFASPNFLKLVMEGERNLSAGSLAKVCKAFELSGNEARFFSGLVAFNQAKTLEAKERAYDALKRSRSDLPLRRVEHSQFEYFDHWYVVAIRELVGLKDFKEDPAWIRSRLKGKVSLPQIRQSLKLLERLGFIQRNAKGRWVPSQASLTTGDEVAHLGIYRYHESMMKKAQESLRSTDPDHRDISSVTVALSKSGFLELKQKLQNFRKEILALAEKNESPDAVCQLNLQLFPLTEIPWDA